MRFYHRLIRTLILPNNAGPNDPSIIIGQAIPAAVVNYYLAEAPISQRVVQGIIEQLNASEYLYDVLIVPAAGGSPAARAVGNVRAGNVQESYRIATTLGPPEIQLGAHAAASGSTIRLRTGSQLLGNSGSIINTLGEADFGGSVFFSVSWELLNGGFCIIHSGAIQYVDGTLDITPSGWLEIDQGAFTCENIDQPRGWLSVMDAYGGTVLSTGGAEAAVPAIAYLNMPTMTFRNGRVYAIIARFGIYKTAGGDAQATVRIRKGSVSTVGTQLAFWVIQMPSATYAGLVQSQTQVGYFKNSSGGTVNTALSLTLTFALGAAQVALFGDANIPIQIAIVDVGSTTTGFGGLIQGSLASV